MSTYHFLLVFMILPACLLFCLPMKRPSLLSFWPRFLAAALVFAAITVPFSLYLLSLPMEAPFQRAFWIVRPLLAYGLIALVLWISLSLSGPELFYLAIWVYLTRELAYHFSLVTGRYLAPGSWLFDPVFVQLTLICHLLVYAGVYFSICRRLSFKATSRSELSMATAMMVLVTILKPVTVFVENGGLEFNLFALTESFLSVFAMILLSLEHGAKERNRLESQLEVQRRLWREHEKQMENARQQTEVLNARYHDLKHYVDALRAMNDSGARGRVLDDLEKTIQVFDAKMDTGYELLDVILTEKALLCQHEEIKLSCVAEGALLKEMDAVDLYVLLGNALDNALEAVSVIEDPSQRVISLSIFPVKEMVKIQIENPCAKEVQMQEGLPLTTKEDAANHGYGLKSILSIAQRYGGYMSVTCSDHFFTLHILLPADMGS